MHQVAYVTRQKDGCTTVCSPTNEEILEAIAAKKSEPLIVQRYIEFPKGVPAEYSWANPHVMQRGADCSAVQRFFYKEWRKAIKREEATGHLGPIGALRPDPAPEEPVPV